MFYLFYLMDKRGGILLIIGIIILVLTILLIGTIIYFYNFHVFKTVRICVGEGVDSKVECGVTQDCVEVFNTTEMDMEDAPEFLKTKFQEVLDEMIFCDGSCFIRDVRGINKETNELEMLDFCEEDEIEIVAEIRGKEGLEIWKYIQSQESFQ